MTGFPPKENICLNIINLFPQGDSGAALVTKKGSIWVQSGVVSFGDECAKPNSPGVYVRVSEYQEWISNIIDGNSPGFVNFNSPGVDSDLTFTCPTSPPTTTTAATLSTHRSTTPDDKGGSVFDSSENVMHFSHFTHFISLCVLVVSRYVLVGDA